MPSKTEQQRRKALLAELEKKSRAEFEDSLPMSRAMFRALFDYLDEYFPKYGCDGTNRHAVNFLQQTGRENIATVLEWLAEHGGYCDCEILANTEGLFE
jgi:hypothetical protein